MIKKFKVAFNGLFLAYKDKSIIIQFILGIIALMASLIIKVSKIELLIILLCIGLVVSTEILNTCIEEICNMYSTQHNPKIKYIKDLGAGAVLFASIISLICGLLIFIPYLI